MEQLISLDWLTVLTLILGVSSVILAIVSICLSAVFYRWAKLENEKVSDLTVKITEKVACLEKLFNKMYDSTYEIIKENNRAMQHQIFSESVGNQDLINRDMEVYLAVEEKGGVSSIEEIVEKTGFNRADVERILKRMAGKEYIVLEETKVTLPERSIDSEGSSD